MLTLSIHSKWSTSCGAFIFIHVQIKTYINNVPTQRQEFQFNLKNYLKLVRGFPTSNSLWTIKCPVISLGLYNTAYLTDWKNCLFGCSFPLDFTNSYAYILWSTGTPLPFVIYFCFSFLPSFFYLFISMNSLTSVQKNITLKFRML